MNYYPKARKHRQGVFPHEKLREEQRDRGRTAAKEKAGRSNRQLLYEGQVSVCGSYPPIIFTSGCAKGGDRKSLD